MATAKLYSPEGSFKEDITLPEQFFDTEVSNGCIFLTVKAYLANQRQGTHKSKTKAEVSGGGKKPWKQKGTGHARQGSTTSPNWVRGGTAHGPKPHKYTQKINKKVKRKALASALTVKAKSSSVHVFESLSFDAPKTKAFLNAMSNAGIVNNKRILFLISAQDTFAYESSSNIPWARVMRVQDANTYELIRAHQVVFSKESLGQLGGGNQE
jgi:large subunit ribosomal protein L4